MLTFNFNPFPVLSTERLILRRVIAADKNELFVMRSDKDIMKFIPRPLAKSPDDALQLIEKFDSGIDRNESINWGITLKEHNKLIGVLGYVRIQKENFRGEIGYLLHKAFHQKGIMQEAVAVVLDYGFKTMKFHTIEAIIDPENISSEKLLQKNNFIKEAHFKENFFHEGKFLDSVHYTLQNQF